MRPSGMIACARRGHTVAKIFTAIGDEAIKTLRIVPSFV